MRLPLSILPARRPRTTGLAQRRNRSERRHFERLEERAMMAADVDLRPMSLVAPPSVAVGSGQVIEVSWVVQNFGTEAADVTNWFDDLYISDDETLDFTDKFVGFAERNDPVFLAPGETYQFTRNILIPNIAQGNRFLIVNVDGGNALSETDESNNVLATPIQFLPPAVDVDLQITSTTAPETASPGDVINVSYTLTNFGPDATSGSFYSDVYLSDDEIWDSSDVFLGNSYFDGTIPADGTHSDTFEVDLTGTAPGHKFLLFIADSIDWVAESNETNNILTAAIEISGPDLTPSLNAYPSLVAPGSVVHFSWSTSNVTSAPPTSNWHDQLYFSTDTFLDSEDLLVYDFEANPTLLDEEGFYLVDAQFSLPADFPTGTGYWILVSDYYDEVQETSELNNISAAVLAIADVDLSIEASVTPDTLAVGNQIQLDWTVTNVGSDSVPEFTAWMDSVYLSNDAIFDSNDVLLTDQFHFSSFALGANESYSESLTLTLTQGAAYLLFVTNDPRQGSTSVAEGDFTNNVQAIALTIEASPDLAIASLETPDEMALGGNYQISWQGTNVGNADLAQGWIDDIYLSKNNVFGDSDDIFLRSAFNFPGTPLGPGQSYQQSAFITIPFGSGEAPGVIEPGTYYVFVRLQSFGEDANALNNLAVQQVELIIPDVDLHVGNVVAPDVALLGSTINFSFDITNLGSESADAQPIYGAVYYSDDAIWDAEDFQLKLHSTFNPLAANETFSISSSLTLRSGKVGAHFLIFVADPFNGQVETNDENNYVAVAINLAATDLSVTASAPGSGISGTQALVSWTVTNEGPFLAPSNTFYSDAVYFSTDAIWDSNDTQLANRIPAGFPLAIGGEYSNSANITLPNVTPGTYYLIVFADNRNNAYPETDENNNFAVIEINIVQSGTNLATDSVTSPTSADVGQQIDIAHIVTNLGTGITGSWIDAMYLSSDQTLSINDTFLGSTSHTNQTIGAGASYTNSYTNIFIGARPQGSYYLIFEIDTLGQLPETNNGDNLYVVPIEINAANFGLVDMSLSSSTVGVGQTVDVTYTIRNTGNLTATTAGSDRIELVLPTTGLAFLTNVSFADEVPLAPNQEYTKTVTVTIPPNLAIGNYQIRVTANYFGQQVEGSRADNVQERSVTLIPAPLPDLVVTSVVSSDQVLEDKEFDVTWTVTNNGTAAATGSFLDDVNVYDLGGALIATLGSFSFTGTIGVGESITRTQRLNYNSSAGSFHIRVNTDSFSAIAEGFNGEQNNFAFGNTFTVIAAPPPPDLVITNIVAPSDGVLSGTTVQVSFTVTNLGGATNAAQWLDYFFIASDPNVTYGTFPSPLDDQEINNLPFRPIAVQNASYLNTGESYVQTVDLTIPNDYFGPFYLYAMANGIGFHFPPPGLVEPDRLDNLSHSEVFNVTLRPPADLQVTSVQAPTTSFSGQTIDLSWTVTNFGAGATAVSTWTDAVYLSFDSELGPGDFYLGSFIHNGSIIAFGSYTTVQSITLPEAISGEFYFIVLADDGSQVFEHIFEDNNAGADLGTILLTPPPDLELEILAVTPQGSAGREVELTYRVTNAGSTITPQAIWNDSFYLSVDGIFDPDFAEQIGTIGHVGTLAPNMSYTKTVRVTLPPSALGSYELFAFSDFEGEVFELDKSNNLDQSPIQVVSTPSDLMVTEVTAPTSVLAGKEILVTWTVTNNGTGNSATDSWFDKVYLSADNVFDASDILLGTFAHKSVLDAGASYNQSVAVTVPFSVSGQRFLFVVADADQTLPVELAFDNNASQAFPLNVVRNTPDLVVSGITLPPSLITGQSATISWTVTNQGGGDTNVSYWYDDVFLSTDPDFNGNVTYLGSVLRNAALAAGGSYTGTLTTTILETLSAGSYYIQVRTDRPTPLGIFDAYTNRVTEDGAEGNNTRVAGAIALSEGPTANLAVTAITNPTTAYAGRPFEVSWTVTNSGVSTGNKAWYDTVHISLDSFFDAATDRFIGYKEHLAGLDAGASYSETASFSVPAGYTGVFYVFVVTDSSNRVFERANEADNISFNPSVLNISLLPPVDLTVGSIDIPTTGTLGSNISIFYTINNQSVGTAFGQWDDAVYLSADGNWDIDDILLGRVLHIGDVAGGTSYTSGLTTALPGVAPGSYKIIIRTDIRNRILETNEANNIGASLNSVAIDAAELPLGAPTNVVLTNGDSVYYKVTVAAGQTLRFRAGANSQSTSTEMYVSFGGPPTRTNYDFRYSTPFDNDQEIVIGDTKAGTYYVLIHADSVRLAADFFTIQADVIPFSVQSVDLGIVGNAGSVTIGIHGARFDRDTRFELVGPGGQVVAASAALVKSGGLAYATFDLTSTAVGLYDVRAIALNNSTAILEDAVSVVIGRGGNLLTNVKINDIVLTNAIDVVRITYANDGDSDVIAPWLTLTTPTNTPMGRTVDDLATGRLLDFIGLGSSGLPVLRPGESITIPIYFQAGATTADRFEFELNYIDENDSRPIDWLIVEDLTYSEFRDAADWSSILGRLQSNIGTIWGDFAAMLARNAALMVPEEGNVNSIMSLLGLEVRRAAAEVRTSISGHISNADPSLDLSGRFVVADNITTGDSYGVYTLKDGSFLLESVTAGDYVFVIEGVLALSPVAISVSEGDAITNLAIEVVRGGSIEGFVAGTSGAAADLTRVLAIGSDGNNYYAELLGGGRYLIEGLPDGSYRLLIDAEGHARTLLNGIVVAEASNAARDIVLQPEASIFGQVTLAPGGSTEGETRIVASLTNGPLASNTFFDSADPESFSVSGLPEGIYTLTISRNGYTSIVLSNVVVAANSVVNVGSHELLPVATIRGSLAPSSATINIANVTVGLFKDGVQVDVAFTDANGDFEFIDVATGEFTIGVFRPDGLVQIPTVSVAPGQVLEGVEVPIVLGGTILGRVLNSGNGNPLGNVPVFLISPDGLIYSTLADSQGNYRFDGLRAGTARVYIVLGNDVASSSIQIVGQNGEEIVADLSIETGAMIHGLLVDAQGNRITGGILYLYQGTTLAGVASSGDEGEFGFLLADGGTYEIVASYAGMSFARIENVTVANGGSTSRIVAAGTGSVTIQIADPGHSIVGSVVTLFQRTPDGEILVNATLAEESGVVTFGLIAEGSYRITVSGAGNRGATVDTEVAADEDLQIQINLVQNHLFQGQITDIDQNPLAGALLVFRLHGTDNQQFIIGTGIEGRYAISGLRTGTYDVSIILDGYIAQVIRNVSIGADNTLDAALTVSTTLLTGRLIDGSGQPMAHAQIVVTDADGNLLGWADADENGIYSIRTVVGTNLTIKVYLYGYLEQEVQGVDVPPGVTTSLADIVVTPAAIGGNPAVAAALAAEQGPDPEYFDKLLLRKVHEAIRNKGGMLIEQATATEQAIRETQQLWVWAEKREIGIAKQKLDRDFYLAKPPGCSSCNGQYESAKQAVKIFNKDRKDFKAKAEPYFESVGQYYLAFTKDTLVVAGSLAGIAIGIVPFLAVAEVTTGTLVFASAVGLLQGLVGSFQAMSGVGSPPDAKASIQNLIANIASTNASFFDLIATVGVKGGIPAFGALGSVFNLNALVATANHAYDDSNSRVDLMVQLQEEYEVAKARAKISLNKVESSVKKLIECIEADSKRDKKCCNDSPTPGESDGASSATDTHDDHEDHDDCGCGCGGDCGGEANGAEASGPGCQPPPNKPNNNNGNGGGGGGDPRTPNDPNDIYGPVGFGEEQFVQASQTLEYTIRFENQPTAGAPAQEATIVQQLDADLDWRTFRVGAFGFGDLRFEVPLDQPFLIQRLDLRDAYGIYLDVVGSIDVQTGIATWTFTSIDPATGEKPSNGALGFLPPNDESGIGQAFLTYSIKAKTTAATGDVIDALATIVFDTQPPIDTPTWSNTLDAEAPSSSVFALPPTVENEDFLVQWAGASDGSGSGLASYTIYVSENGNKFTAWLNETTLTEASFHGTAGSTYAFYSVTHDNAGNTEALPGVPDAFVTLEVTNESPTGDAGGPYAIQEGDSLFLDGSASFDPDSSDDLIYSWDVNGDGVFGDAAGVAPTLTWAQLVALGISDNGSYMVKVQVQDSLGAIGTSSAVELLVGNTAPIASMVGPISGVRGQRRTFTLAAADFSPGDQAGSFIYEIDWNGDGAVDQTIVGTALTTVSHTFTTNGVYQLFVTATDQNGGKSEVIGQQIAITSFALQADEAEPTRNNLVIGGTTSGDLIAVIGFGPNLLIWSFGFDGQNLSMRPDSYSALVLGVTGRVIVYGQDGDDLLSTQLLVGVNAEIYGGLGNDILTAGGGADLLTGDAGDDILLGNLGNDSLFGGDGSDLLFGGFGADRLHGGIGDDLLVAGATSLENSSDAALAVRAEWTSNRSYGERTANLTGTGSGPRANGNNFLQAGSTVLDDSSIDEVFGDEGQDWIFIDSDEDLAIDLAENELMTEL